MFKPNSKFNGNNGNKRSYYVVLDHIISGDNINKIDKIDKIDGNHFVSGSHKITDTLTVSFINDYKITDKTNPIGFWQTILNNHSFEYSVNFKYKFKIDDTDLLYLISFDTVKGITLHTDTNLVDIYEFDDVDIDFNSFNNFKIIKTRQQIKQDKSRFWRKAILINIIFYALFLSAIFAYYQYKAGTLEVINERLLSLQSEIVDLNLEVESVKANAVVSGSSAQQHIANLLHIISGVGIQRSEIDLTQSLCVITISLDDVDMLKHLAKVNNIAIKIVRNFSKNTASVSWEVRGNE